MLAKIARLLSSWVLLLCATTTPRGALSFSPHKSSPVVPVGVALHLRQPISSRLDVSRQGIAESISPNGAAEAVGLPSPETVRSASAPPTRTISKWKASLTKLGMMGFVLSMCIALPLTLLPQQAAYKMGLMDRLQKEKNAVWTGQFCARWMLRLFPFMRLQTFPYHDPDPPPSIWVSNHCSSLDVFILLAVDKRLRGPFRRPIKIVYWKQLEDNPVTKLLFQQAGFIPIQMAANKAGEDNDYDKSSFRQLLKDTKRAFAEGFDIGILPEGQLNPDPEAGLLPLFSGAFTLARMSRRPVQMIAMNGAHNLWHPVDGMNVKGRHVKARVYPTPFRFTKAADFVDSFQAIVGSFATTGKDLPRDELDSWLNGDKLKETKSVD
jgi:1-acyl-sn-glycerol-3-phosphate acyltransferase